MKYVVAYRKRRDGDATPFAYTADVVDARSESEAVANVLEGQYVEDAIYVGYVGPLDTLEEFTSRRDTTVDVESTIGKTT